MHLLTVRHTTVYRYRQPVAFGEHRLMFRPRDSHDLRLIDTALLIEPAAEVSWHHDVFGNSIAIARFSETAATLGFVSAFRVEHYGIAGRGFPIAAFARDYPFSYAVDEIPDLARSIERHYPDPDHRIDAWARRFVGRGSGDTLALLTRMTESIARDFRYEKRLAQGVQAPVETLDVGGGSCRDFALLMIEAARALGFAARFVSGYLYDPALEGATPPAGLRAAGSLAGGGATHAWVQVYLPGAGWVEFDPTNGLVGGTSLIRVAVARDPGQAIPLSGTFLGPSDAGIAMEVDVRVTADEDAEAPLIA